MKNKGPLYDQIEAFLNGHLTGDELEVMKNAIANDPELAQEIELRRLEFEVSEALIAQNIRDQIHRLRTPEAAPPTPVSGFKFRGLLWMIAGLLSIAAISIYWCNRPITQIVPALEPSTPPGQDQKPPVLQGDPVPQANQDQNPSDPKPVVKTPTSNPASRQLAIATELYVKPDLTLRGASPVAGDAYELAFTAFENEEYKAAIDALQNFPATDPRWMRALTLRAHAQYNLKRFAQASQTFSTISDSKILPWSEEADWYVLLALLADGKANTAAFRSRLETLNAVEGHPYADEGQDVKRRLRDH